MRWERGHESSNVEDRRGPRVSYGGGGGVAQLGLMLIGRGKTATIIGILLLIGAYVGPQFFSSSPSSSSVATAPRNDEGKQFVAFVLDDNQATWERLLRSSSTPYRPARLVLFTRATQTACGMGKAAAGPFYCPADEKVYIDLAFYDELKNRFGAAGDFAQAYVIGHEIGHHVQKVVGTNEQVRRRERAEPKNERALSIATELQADCYAGVWAHATNERELLEAGDVDEALTAAAAVGDDALQKASTGAVRPETWTHGSSADRKAWFQRGFQSGNPQSCDTFAAAGL